ncbi:hypothetical protein [Neobacillus sp. D3-1R]|uniref:hypothetical protein n=1 Tax=Neobacillus sp. D3-1R TaxID=3445778 RepID=UPI003FA08364
MINNPDIIERLGLLIGKELTDKSLHETIFCEAKHKNILRRFGLGKRTYIQSKLIIQDNPDSPSFADISILGNPNTFRVGIEEKEGKIIINSDPRISYTYL